MTEEQAKFWKEGYEAGIKAILIKNQEEIKIGKAIMEVMYERFQTHKE